MVGQIGKNIERALRKIQDGWRAKKNAGNSIYIGSKGPEIASDLLKIENFLGPRPNSPWLVITCYTSFEMLAALGFLAGRYSLFEITSAGS